MSRLLSILLATLLLVALLSGVAVAQSPPNILLVITDDQGFGDLGANGNPIVQTPRTDAFAKEAVRLKNFYVSPVCSPTRSSLLSGQYNYRTGVVDTFIGRSMMRPDVKTIAEYLAAAGYRTGLFGKWHLGDNYPMRPEDRGFQETLWHQGGGLAQPGDAPELDAKTAYFDPVLRRNGKDVKTKGYCTDVFTDAAIDFIKADAKKPFFAYVAYNCPHGPFQVPDELRAKYAKFDLTENGFPKIGQPWATKKLNTDEIARAYGMVENIDTNFGRMLQTLEDRKVAENTIVIYMTDNGPGGVRWNGGLRARKGTVYDGGIRVPCYVRWPASFKGARSIDTPLAHIDVTPTLLGACGVKGEGFDGESFLGLLKGDDHWHDRTLFFQWHRGDDPEKYRAFAARGPRYKLVQSVGVQPAGKWQPKYELFDMTADPFEQKDLAEEKPDEVAKLKKEYEAWFASVTKKGFAPPRIVIGSEKENPVRLSRQDWRGPNAGWAADSEGYWEVKVERAGNYRIQLLTDPATEVGFKIGTRGGGSKGPNPEKELDITVPLDAGEMRFEAWAVVNGQRRGVRYATLEYLGPVKK